MSGYSRESRFGQRRRAAVAEAERIHQRVEASTAAIQPPGLVAMLLDIASEPTGATRKVALDIIPRRCFGDRSVAARLTELLLARVDQPWFVPYVMRALGRLGVGDEFVLAALVRARALIRRAKTRTSRTRQWSKAAFKAFGWPHLAAGGQLVHFDPPPRTPVAIVVNPYAGWYLASLASRLPVWVRGTRENLGVAERFMQERPGQPPERALRTFDGRDREDAEAALIEMLPIVASEPGRHPGLQPWDCIEVDRAAVPEKVRAAFAAIGAFDIVATKLGFFARCR